MFYTMPWDNDPEITVLCTENGVSFPPSETNDLYCQYLAWVAEGNEPEPWEPESN